MRGWSEKEIGYLRQNYGHIMIKQIADHLGRTQASVERKLRHLKLVIHPSWTQSEVDILHQYYNNVCIKELRRLLPTKSRYAIFNKAAREGLVRQPVPWTSGEIEILKRHFRNANPQDLLTKLPNRSWEGIRTYAWMHVKLRRKRGIFYHELLLKSILDKLLPGVRHWDNVRPRWLVNADTGRRLELDRYYPRLHLGIEYNGEQHYETLYAGSDVERQKHRDRVKQDLCERYGVRLLVFNKQDDLTVDSVKKKLGFIEEILYLRNDG